MTAFDRLDRMASRAVDRLNSESLTLIPMRSRPNGPAAIDPDRSPATGRGVFSVKQVPVALQSGARQAGSKANDFRTLTGGETIEVSIDRFANPDINACAGDHLEIRGRRFAVVAVKPDGQAGVAITLETVT